MFQVDFFGEPGAPGDPYKAAETAFEVDPEIVATQGQKAAELRALSLKLVHRAGLAMGRVAAATYRQWQDEHPAVGLRVMLETVASNASILAANPGIDKDYLRLMNHLYISAVMFGWREGLNLHPAGGFNTAYAGQPAPTFDPPRDWTPDAD